MTGRWAEDAVALLHATLGAVLLTCPARVATAALGRVAEIGPVRATRLLGIRHLAQAGATVAAPAVFTPARGAVIDATHALTLVPLLAGRRYRRAAALNLVVAAALAGLGAATGAGAIEPTGEKTT